MASVEIEARFRIDDPQRLIERLADMGIHLSQPIDQDDQAYAPRSWSYGMDRVGVPFARLRTEGSRHLFTVKTPISDVRTCREQETVVVDRAAMHEAILMMGFRPTVQIRKRRWQASVAEGYTVCVDEVEHAGWFVEVEALAGPDDDHEAVRARLERWIKGLRIAASRVTESYDTIVRAAIGESSRAETPAWSESPRAWGSVKYEKPATPAPSPSPMWA